MIKHTEPQPLSFSRRIKFPIHRAPEMEGIGSRLGRASSRYGPALVFSSPVRKWKRQWVHVSSSPSYHSHSNNNNNASSALLLCRWTPINHSADSDKNFVKSDEPPRRKFRYTPVSSVISPLPCLFLGCYFVLRVFLFC